MSDEEFLANLGNIDNEKLIQSLGNCGHDGYYNDLYYPIIEEIKRRLSLYPSAEPDNQVHLCGFCKYDYPECPAEMSDVIFGNGTGHDNICACAKFEIKPERIATETEQTAKVVHSTTFGEWKNMCGRCFAKGRKMGLFPGQNYCYECGCKLDWSDDE